MLDYTLPQFAADMAALRAAAPAPAPVPARAADAVGVIARAMLELEAEGATVDADALQVRTRLPRGLIEQNAQAARDRACTLSRPRIRVKAGRA